MYDIEHRIEEINCYYTIVSYHRDNSNPEKSKWTIQEDEELLCFVQSIKQSWKNGKFAWGLHIINGIIEQLGVNKFREPAKCAKFVDPGQNDKWHGYPADFIRNSHDRPTPVVLKVWNDQNLITKPQMVRILQGKCSL
jgi:hypothetical protein